jgi:hypothetical protein
MLATEGEIGYNVTTMKNTTTKTGANKNTGTSYAARMAHAWKQDNAAMHKYDWLVGTYALTMTLALGYLTLALS